MKLYIAIKHYEYGFRVLLQTYCIVLISESEKFVKLLFHTCVNYCWHRCLFSCKCMCLPHLGWVGENLYKLVAKNFNGVATFLEGQIRNFLLSFFQSADSIPISVAQFYLSCGLQVVLRDTCHVLNIKECLPRSLHIKLLMIY